MKKSFATLSTKLSNKIDELDNEDSDLTNSDSDEEGDSNFQMGFTMVQLKANKIPGVQHEETVLQQSFEKRIADVLFKQNHGKNIGLDLENVILLDSQSTMDLFCNHKLVHKVSKSSNKMKLQSNGGTMTVGHKASINRYDHEVWFSKNAITNIIALSNLIQQYRVTYDSNDLMFVVHREAENKPNMEFHMHKSGLHFSTRATKLLCS